MVSPRAVEPGGQHVDAAAQADEKAGEHGDQRRGGAHGAQSLGADELPHHRQIRQVEEHLQQVGADQGQAEQVRICLARGPRVMSWPERDDMEKASFTDFRPGDYTIEVEKAQ